MGGRRKTPEWQPNQDVDDSVLVWRALVRHGLTRRRPLLGGYGLAGLFGGLGAGTGGHLFTGPAADALAHAQQAAIRGSASQDGADARLAAMQLAALELEDRLTPFDRARLRASGELPGWFSADLKVRAEEIRKKRQRSSRA